MGSVFMDLFFRKYDERKKKLSIVQGISNVLKIGSVTESEKLPIHELEAEPMVESRLNQIKPGLERLLVDVSIDRID